MLSNIFANLQRQQILKIRINTRGWLSVIIVLGITLILLISFGRVITNATSNYEVYQYEQTGLDKLQAENDSLKQELGYYSSYEYKLLYARDYLHMAEPGERLYKIVGSQQYYQVEEQQPNFVTVDTYSYWWSQLL